jgi:hypothetical protein
MDISLQQKINLVIFLYKKNSNQVPDGKECVFGISQFIAISNKDQNDEGKPRYP